MISVSMMFEAPSLSRGGNGTLDYQGWTSCCTNGTQGYLVCCKIGLPYGTLYCCHIW